MTSAHCISPYLHIARLGEYDLFSQDDGANPMDFAIEKTKIHEEYRSDIVMNDIAMVKLRNRVPVNGEYSLETIIPSVCNLKKIKMY